MSIVSSITLLRNSSKILTLASLRAGSDGLQPPVLKELADVLTGPLALIFNKSLEEWKLLAKWKDAHVTPMFKKGNKSKPGNYRPIGLTNVLGKVMVSVIRDKAIEHIDKNEHLSEWKHGFVRGRSCCTNHFAVLEEWTDTLNAGTSVDAIYLDFAKAFDSVTHRRLFSKLTAYRVKGRVLDWISYFLIGRGQRACVNGATRSELTEIRSGVLQGSVLGPVPFVVFTDHLPAIASSVCKMYGDDAKVSRPSCSEQDRWKLRADLDNLVD